MKFHLSCMFEQVSQKKVFWRPVVHAEASWVFQGCCGMDEVRCDREDQHD